MLNIKKIIILFFLLLFLQGCLVFKSVSYEINLSDNNSGTVTMKFTDIRSDAANTSELEADKKRLFQDMLKSNEFVEQNRDEGKNIIDRKLYISEGKLDGTVKYTFDDISNVENFVYQEPFYYVTFNLQDSIISTNGEVVISKDHKRIMWDNSIKTLKFEWFSTDTKDSDLVELVQYYDQEK
jgi:hypothetical protein